MFAAGHPLDHCCRRSCWIYNDVLLPERNGQLEQCLHHLFLGKNLCVNRMLVGIWRGVAHDCGTKNERDVIDRHQFKLYKHLSIIAYQLILRPLASQLLWDAYYSSPPAKCAPHVAFSRHCLAEPAKLGISIPPLGKRICILPG